MVKALHITYRFGKDVIGGAEHYHYKICQYLAKQGFDITVAATQTKDVPHYTRFGVKWDNTLPKYEETDGIKIYRFPTYNLPKPVMGILAKILQNRFEKESQQIKSEEFIDCENVGVLGSGWHYPEKQNDKIFRWTQQKFNIHISDKNVHKIIINAQSKSTNKLSINVNNSYLKTIDIKSGSNTYEIDINGVDNPNLEFTLSKIWRPIKDIRGLGIYVSSVFYRANNETKEIPLDHDFKDYFGEGKVSKWVEVLNEISEKRPIFFDHIFDITRGPISIDMLSFIKKNIKDYDIILGTNIPFATLNYAANMAYYYNKPLVLLPFAHIEDDFYHWKKYNKSLVRADKVLALTPFSKENFFDKIGANAEVVGAGIEPEEYNAELISEEEFRNKFELGDSKILLFVGRKSNSKKYDILINAVEKLNNEFNQKVILLVIGPDEDKIDINSPNVKYLGKVDREILLSAYKYCDVFAIMSESESFGMVVLEARMFKKPVIVSSKCGALSSLVDNGQDGFLCSNKDEVADKVNQLILDKDFSCRMGESGYTKTIENFTWESVSKKIIKIYNDILKNF